MRALRQSHYDSSARLIQAHWRGHYARKHYFNYYARKAYLHEVELNNARIRWDAGLDQMAFFSPSPKKLVRCHFLTIYFRLFSDRTELEALRLEQQREQEAIEQAMKKVCRSQCSVVLQSLI